MHPTTSSKPAHAHRTPTRYTPGPWHEHSHRQIGPAAGIVCEVGSAIGGGDAIAQADANVLLIAAAPDLHQACVTAAALLTRQKFIASPHSPEGAVLLALRAALALVEGARDERHVPHLPGHARTPATCASKLKSVITFLDNRLHDSEEQLARESGAGAAFYRGRVTAFALALDELREVAK